MPANARLNVNRAGDGAEIERVLRVNAADG